MTNEQKKLIINQIAAMGITPSDEQCEQLYTYFEMLVDWNTRMNLTGITEFNDVVIKHFADSAAIARTDLMTQVKSLIDIGTGAGFPGMVLKILYPEVKVTLLDTLNKRLIFLQAVIDELGLEEIETVHSRAEDYVKKPGIRESYDLCVSRAVADLRVLSEYCMPYVKIGGYFVPYKSGTVDEECKNAEKTVKTLGGKPCGVNKFELPENSGARSLVIIKKTLNTPKKYPRKAGTPAKDPL